MHAERCTLRIRQAEPAGAGIDTLHKYELYHYTFDLAVGNTCRQSVNSV